MPVHICCLVLALFGLRKDCTGVDRYKPSSILICQIIGLIIDVIDDDICLSRAGKTDVVMLSGLRCRGMYAFPTVIGTSVT